VNDVLNAIRERAHALFPEVVALRRDFHRHPELAFAEKRTAQVVSDYLARLGLKVETGVAGTGVLAVLEGGRPGKTVALRADMDALPLSEDTGLPFASENPGVMHACGHDGHTAMLLGAAKVLAGLRKSLGGNVKFIFQPSEEKLPSGALALREAGALEGVDAVFGLHLWPSVAAGHIGVTYGPMMAAADYAYLTITGQAGHGSTPHLAIDPVVTAAQVILGLQTIVSRQVDPLDQAVISVGTIHGGTAPNIIPGEVEFAATVRTLTPEIRKKLPALIERTARGIAQSAGAACTCRYEWGLPPVINSDTLVALVEEVGRDLLGAENVERLSRPVMGSEDFAYYLEQVPGAFFWLGAKNESRGILPLAHHPKYTFDEAALETGVTILAGVAARFLAAD
jgi:amidohydrolase